MKKRIMTVLVPIVLIFLVIAAALASQLFERFSYSKNQADLTEYFHLAQPDEVAMVVQDTLAEEKALLRDGVVYFALSTVEKYFTDRFLCQYDRAGAAVYDRHRCHTDSHWGGQQCDVCVRCGAGA